jgi:hypothetical protein
LIIIGCNPAEKIKVKIKPAIKTPEILSESERLGIEQIKRLDSLHRIGKI